MTSAYEAFHRLEEVNHNQRFFAGDWMTHIQRSLALASRDGGSNALALSYLDTAIGRCKEMYAGLLGLRAIALELHGAHDNAK